jgi:hypothetical protein
MFAVLAGLGILTMALFPIALPGLLLFVVAPLALVAVVGLLVAIPFVLPMWLARIVIRSRSRRRRAAGQPVALTAEEKVDVRGDRLEPVAVDRLSP